jgi:hypothetical protein
MKDTPFTNCRPDISPDPRSQSHSKDARRVARIPPAIGQPERTRLLVTGYGGCAKPNTDNASVRFQAQGGFYDLSTTQARSEMGWLAVPWCVLGTRISYRKSWFEEVWFREFFGDVGCVPRGGQEEGDGAPDGTDARAHRAGPRESDNRLSLARLWERTSTDDQVDTQSL